MKDLKTFVMEGWYDDPLLMIPGPSELHPRVREVLAGRFYPHYGHEWKELYEEVEDVAKRIFKTKNEIIVMPGPGCLGLELGVLSVAERGEKVVAVVNGFFGERFAEIAKLCGLNLVKVEAGPGMIVPPSKLEEALDGNPDAKALISVQNESATGTLNPVKDYVMLAKKRGLFTVIDSVSAYGGVDLDVDGWGIDVCVGYANKCLGSIPGALPVSISSEVWERVERGLVKPNSFMTNLAVWSWYRKNWGGMGHPYPTTVNTFAYLAFKVAAEAALSEGLEKRYERHRTIAMATREAVKAMGLELTVHEDSHASPTITAIDLPSGARNKLQEVLKTMLTKHRIMIGGGLGSTAGRAIRIGHMGVTADPRYVVPTLTSLTITLRDAGVEVEKVGTVIDAFYSAI